MVRLESICEGVAGRINEDALFYANDGRFITMAVIDGVTDRVVSCRNWGALDGDIDLTGAAFAASVVRDSIISLLNESWVMNNILLSCNRRLRMFARDVYGDFTPQAIFEAEPGLAPYADDPRYFRLVLPACVVTIARVDLQQRLLDYAHVGDTELVIFTQDGRVESITQTIPPRWEQGLIDAQDADPIIRKHKQHGLLHNYTDPQGNTDPNIGIGVLNGMEELADYVQSSQISLDGVTDVILCSDGFLLPPETPNRLSLMAEWVDQRGIQAYLHHLRTLEQQDSERKHYPRPKIHDDATAIHLKLS
ncbi:MAG: hypothetical protein Kow00117_07490 [Phototrophicales bacterium]